jgi:hypothetical protein
MKENVGGRGGIHMGSIDGSLGLGKEVSAMNNVVVNVRRVGLSCQLTPTE